MCAISKNKPKLDSIIPLAKIVRVHGLPVNGGLRFKCQLISVGGEAFKNQKEFFLCPGDRPNELHNNVTPIATLEMPKALGGAFGAASAVVVALPCDPLEAKSLIGQFIGLKRSSLPRLKEGFYLVDLFGKTVVNERDENVGIVVGVRQEGKGSPNVLVKQDNREIELPLAWAVLPKNEMDIPEKIKIPGIESWILDNKEKADDAD